jgi:ribosomal protein S18 acetylase RimI-like enzyme
MTQPRLRHDFTPAEIDQLEDRLYEHNAAASGHRDGLGLGYAMDAITADVDPRNVASLRLLARLGFEETGRAARTCQVGDEWQDSVYLALRRP